MGDGLASPGCLQSGSHSFADCAWTDADELIRLGYCAVPIGRAGPRRAGAVVQSESGLRDRARAAREVRLVRLNSSAHSVRTYNPPYRGCTSYDGDAFSLAGDSSFWLGDPPGPEGWSTRYNCVPAHRR